MARKNEKIYATNHVTIVHNWKSCSRCHSMFIPKRVWTGTCIRRLKNLCLEWHMLISGTCSTFDTSYPSQTITQKLEPISLQPPHSDPSGVLVLHLNKGVGQGHSSLAQSIGTSFGSKESRRSAPISVWKQLGSFGGCPNSVHEIVSNRRCVGHQVTSRSPKRNSFGYLLEKDTDCVHSSRLFLRLEPRPEW